LKLLDEWLTNAPLRPSTQIEYRREVTRWLAWCAAQRPAVHPYRVGPEHVARWCDEKFLRYYLGDIPFTGPEALEVLAAEHPDVAKTHDRRITALVQYYLAARDRRLVLTPPHLYDLRSGVDRDKGAPQRLDPRERAAFLKAVGAWGPDHSQHHQRDQLLAYLLLAGLRPAQAVRLDIRLMEEQPDGGWHCRVPDDLDGPGRPMELDPLVGDAIKDYIPHRPTPKPGEWALLLSRTGRPLYSRFPNELVRAIADTSPRLAQRPRAVTADAIAHTGLWDEPVLPARSAN
jgi:integrase